MQLMQRKAVRSRLRNENGLILCECGLSAATGSVYCSKHKAMIEAYNKKVLKGKEYKPGGFHTK